MVTDADGQVGSMEWALQSEDLECLPKSHERRAQGQGTWFDTYPGRGAKLKQRVMPKVGNADSAQNHDLATILATSCKF
jgi:hypothetical protein